MNKVIRTLILIPVALTFGATTLYAQTSTTPSTLNTYSTTTAFRQVVYQYNWSTAGTHTLKIVLNGTAGHPRVDFDAVLLLK